MRTFTAVVEKDPDTGLYVGYVPGFRGAHTQGETLDELQKNLQEGKSRHYLVIIWNANSMIAERYARLNKRDRSMFNGER